MTKSEKQAMVDYFNEIDERQKLYNEVKYMHPDGQRLVLPLYLEEIHHPFIESLIAEWEIEKTNEIPNQNRKGKIQTQRESRKELINTSR